MDTKAMIQYVSEEWYYGPRRSGARGSSETAGTDRDTLLQRKSVPRASTFEPRWLVREARLAGVPSEGIGRC